MAHPEAKGKKFWLRPYYFPTAFLLLMAYHTRPTTRSSKQHAVLQIIQVVFSPSGCTPEVSATTSDGPVAVFSP